MPEDTLSIADIRLIALDGERSYGSLPTMRDVAIRVKVDVLEPDGADAGEGPQRTTVLATLFLEVYGADDGSETEDSSQSEVSAPDTTGGGSRPPVYSSRVAVRIDADPPAHEDSEWVPAVFAEAWPYLRAQVVGHALLLGMGRIPVPLEAPENLAREPHPGEE